MNPHNLFLHPEHPTAPNEWVGTVHTASREAVDFVLSQPTGDPDGRSEWVWVRLATGDLILGCFPGGDTYITVLEGDPATAVGSDAAAPEGLAAAAMIGSTHIVEVP